MTDASKLNTFEVASGALRLTDPCYDMDTWCAGTLKNVLNGTWVAETVMVDDPDWGVRVARLIVRHEKYAELDDRDFPCEFEPDLGVDSGQFGFFDLDQFAAQRGGEYGDKTSFYGEVCALTQSNVLAVRNFGAVSTSGVGDGSYSVFYECDDEERVIGAVVIFLYDEDDETDIDDAEEAEDLAA